MNYRLFGKTGLRVSEVGFGAWGLGGDAYGPLDTDVAILTLNCAFDSGVNFYDTADLYGAGRSETLIGKAFSGRRGQVVIATKCGMVPHPSGDIARIGQDFSADHIYKSLERSLTRMQTDYSDLLQLHSPENAVSDEAMDALERLCEQGKTRFYGVSVRNPQECCTVASDHPALASLQVNFSLVDQRLVGGGGLACCREAGAAVIARTPLCFGYLTGALTGDESLGENDHRRVWPIEQRVVWSQAYRAFIDDEFADTPMSPAQFALRFCLSYEDVSTVIPGMMSPEHVTDNVGASGLGPFSADVRSRLEEVYQKNVFYVAKK